MADQTARQLPPTPAAWTDMANGHVIWLHLAWTIAHSKDNRVAELPEDARRELDEGLGRIVDFHERLMTLAVAAKERLAAAPCGVRSGASTASSRRV
jgi:hypothetical protein